MNDTEDVVISDEDYALSARMADARQELQVLEYKASMIMTDAKRQVECLRKATEQARARVRRLMPSYQAMLYRLRIDPQTELDLSENEDDAEDEEAV